MSGAPAIAVDLLDEVIGQARALLKTNAPTKQRIRILWAAAKAARDLAADDVIAAAFMALAVETNLIDRNGRWTGSDIAESRRAYGACDVEHVIRWALRGWNPFETGPLT